MVVAPMMLEVTNGRLVTQAIASCDGSMPKSRAIFEIGVDRGLCPRFLVALSPVEERGPRPGGPGAALVLAGQIALCQRGVGKQAHILAFVELGQPMLVDTVDEVEGILHACDPRLALGLGEMQETRQAPGRLIRKPDVAHLASLHQAVERVERLLDRDLVGMRLARGAAKQRHGAIGPVKLIEIDIVRLKPPQRAFDGLVDVARVEAGGLAVGTEPGIGAASDDLRREDHLVAGAAALEPAAEDLLGRALRLRLGRDRVELGRVEEIDPLIERIVELRVALGLGVLLAPRHGPEADRRDAKAGAAKWAIIERGKVCPGVHVRPVYCELRKAGGPPSA